LKRSKQKSTKVFQEVKMYSIRMRASKNNRHISGAEHLIDEGNIQVTVQSLVERALTHNRGKPDFINISVEDINIPAKKISSLPLVLMRTENTNTNATSKTSINTGKEIAKQILNHLGISDLCIKKSFLLLENGPNNGESMRGAIIMNNKGERIEPDQQRGIRASRMDITKEALVDFEDSLAIRGLSIYKTHIKEALVLATKVASIKGSIAELCWSDDPDYTAGYVASGKLGYIRIPHLKQIGDNHGGRVFFVDFADNANLEDYINQIEKVPVLIDKFEGFKEISESEI